MWRIPITAILLLASSSLAQACEGLTQEQKEAKFVSWVSDNDKAYASTEEHKIRMDVWLQNDAKIWKHNEQQPAPTFLLGHNAYSDMTEEEFHKFFKLGDYSKTRASVEQVEATTSTERALLEIEPLELPDYVNWNDLGGCTPIKNQGACGSCWAFSTTGALEGAKFVKTGELVGLSEQNLLDCDHQDLGCSGGLMDNAFKFDEKSGGLCSELDYPYEAKQNDECRTDCTDVPGSIVKTFLDVPPGSEKALLSAVAMQPISVAIQASQFVFQFYKSGVITDDKCGSSAAVDHGVLAVGYGTDLDTQSPYFLVKNSWGATWGENGFVKLGRGSKNKFGMCAILKMASFPVVE